MITAVTMNDNRLAGELHYYDKGGKIIFSQNWTNGHFKNELDYYDMNLINFFTKLLRIETDSIIYENTNHEVEIVNFPEHIISISSDNGTVMYKDGKWIIRPETSSKVLTLILYANFDAQVKEVLSIQKLVEKRK